jgi:lipopolysaccharide transport system ATP-binding protein
MSVSEIAIRVNNVSKCFKQYAHPVDRLKEIVFPHRVKAKDFWALNDVNLEILRGQTLGIIGQNGSGKSTLLQIIAGTLTPTTGDVQVNGRISALLELGSGFNPEFTGRQNVFFNGRLLGLSQAELLEKFDDIVKFADIGDFIDQPVKTYSSGMFVRLAFAVAVNVDPEILIVDEALAVGDILFQRKCFSKIEELANRGTTILFVSHDLNSILNLCDRAIIIDRHAIICDDKPHPAVLAYSTLMAQREAASDDFQNRKFRHEAKPSSGQTVGESRIGIGGAELLDVELLDAQGDSVQTIKCGERTIVRSTIQFHEDIEFPISGFKIKTLNGIAVVGNSTFGTPQSLPPMRAGTVLTLEFAWNCYLAAGNYTVTVGISETRADQKVVALDRRRDILPLTVIGSMSSYGLLALPVDIEYSCRSEIKSEIKSEIETLQTTK